MSRFLCRVPPRTLVVTPHLTAAPPARHSSCPSFVVSLLRGKKYTPVMHSEAIKENSNKYTVSNTYTQKAIHIAYLIIGMKNKKIIRRDKTSFIQVMFTHTMKVWGDGVKRIAWVIINRFTQAATVCTRQHGNTTLCNLQHQLPLLLCRYDMIRFYFLISTVRKHDIRLWVLRESFHLVITGFVKKRKNNPC